MGKKINLPLAVVWGYRCIECVLKWNVYIHDQVHTYTMTDVYNIYFTSSIDIIACMQVCTDVHACSCMHGFWSSFTGLQCTYSGYPSVHTHTHTHTHTQLQVFHMRFYNVCHICTGYSYTTCRYTNLVYSQLPDIVVHLCLHYIDANQMMIKDMNHEHTCL